MKNRIFVIADTHFGHKNIIQYESEYRPFSSIEEHDQALIDNWNSVVKPTDTVWHLGDVLFGLHSFSLLGKLNGIKKLTLGNHDNYDIREYLKYFTKIAAAVVVKGYLLSHIPICGNQFPRFKGNIHGHMHSRKLKDPRYACVSVEQIGLKPILLDQVVEQICHNSHQ